MSLTEDDLLGKLIDWHNETDTVVRVDVYDPFIIEILQNQKLRKLIEGILTLEITSTRDAEEHQLLQNLLEESKNEN